tara:strand:+ start:418 stop:591 length:174 start_codon:yes stop_codon:yes gene_type:complete
MKIFLTQFTWDGTTHTGPNIIADTWEHAQIIAEGAGLEVIGEIQDIVLTETGLETLH